MGQAILTAFQYHVITLVAKEPALAKFYLSGGTALAAYHFHHRFSDDLDFFIFDEVDGRFLGIFMEQVRQKLQCTDIRFERLYDRHQFFLKYEGNELKVEFSMYPFLQLEPPVIHDGIKVDSLRDISANKLMALIDRFDPKDFVDLYFLLQKFLLQNIQRDVEEKFKIKIDNIFLGGEFAKVKRIAGLPRMVKPLEITELKTFFAEQAKVLGRRIFE